MFSRLHGKGDTNIQIEVIGSTIPEKKLFLRQNYGLWRMAHGSLRPKAQA
jgi:hypothetical protein